MNVVGVRFKQAGKIYYFQSNGIELNPRELVVVNTENGLDIGEVALANTEFNEDKFEYQLSNVIRKANEDDIASFTLNKIDAQEAMEICQERCDLLNLNMKIVDCDYSLDRSKLTFYFTANKRVDFRELVKDLASIFRSRIELRQKGVRDHAKLIKHHGSCGQECCCSRYLTDFAPLSIKYAKDQNISLDPTKISGVCGRLMCCLAYEQDNYIEAKKIMPKYGTKVQTADGEGVVINSDLVRESCKVKIRVDGEEDQQEKVYKLCELDIINSK